MFTAFYYIAVISVILIDYYLYKTRIKKFKVLWILQSLFFILPPLYMNISGYFADIRSIPRMIASMWIIWIFLLQFFSKIFIAISIYIKDRTGRSYIIPAILLTVLTVSFYVYGNFVSRCEIKVNQVELTFKDLPDSFDGYRIAQFSDIHIGTMFLDRNLLERVVDTINFLNPDIVVQSGDLVHIHVNELTESRQKTLKKIKSPVYAVYGNHDLGFYLKDTLLESPKFSIDSLTRIMTSYFNWHLLKNSNEIIRKGTDSIFIAGVVYPDDLNMRNFNSTYGGSDIRKSMKGISAGDFAILISHTPVLIDSLPEKSDAVDMMLSGHVHAMQLKFGNFCPAIVQYREASGLYKKNNVTLYVNDGIGVVGHPFRFGAPPEVTLYILRKHE